MTTPLNLTARAKDAALTGFTLTQAIGEAIGYASTCWIDRDGDLVFDSQAATLLIRDLQAAIAVLLRISNADVLELLGKIYERLALDDPEECAACDTPLAECPMPVAGCCSDCTHAANYSTPHPNDLDHMDGSGA